MSLSVPEPAEGELVEEQTTNGQWIIVMQEKEI